MTQNKDNSSEQIQDNHLSKEGQDHNQSDDTDKDFEAEIALLKDQLLRSLAEVDNAQKRALKEKEDIQKYAITNFSRDLLVIVDTLERALDTIPDEERSKGGLFKTLYDGVKLTHDEIIKSFSKHKIEVINPLHQPFDPLLHQAVNQEDTKDHPSNTVTNVFQKGYTIHGRLLRPAMVSVSR